jgi:predicted ATPase
MRLSDALLMKAEAIARGGSGSGSATILSNLATRAGVTAAAATLDGIYAERGRELWWEGWRRNDAIRFGKFLAARALKPYASDAKYLLYPIPADALFNSNLSQNPGY